MLDSSYASLALPKLATSGTVFDSFAMRKFCQTLSFAVGKIQGVRDVVVADVIVPCFSATTSHVSRPRKELPFLAAVFHMQLPYPPVIAGLGNCIV